MGTGEYSHDEILPAIMQAEIHHVTEKGFSVIWKTGFEEHLRLNENGELFSI